jgi:hypothetical protein
MEANYHRQMSKLAKDRADESTKQILELSNAHAKQIAEERQRVAAVQKQLDDQEEANEFAVRHHRQHAEMCESMSVHLKEVIERQQQQHQQDEQQIQELIELLANAQARCECCSTATTISTDFSFLNAIVDD